MALLGVISAAIPTHFFAPAGADAPLCAAGQGNRGGSPQPPVGHDDPACRRRFPPWRAGEPPTFVGGLREDILFKSKEYPLALPKKDSGRDFEFPSQTLLETTKGRAAALPLETIPGLQGIGGWGPAGDEGRGRFAARLRGTLGRGTEDGGFGACGHSEYSA